LKPCAPKKARNGVPGATSNAEVPGKIDAEVLIPPALTVSRSWIDALAKHLIG
jgi:hypothetical protein